MGKYLVTGCYNATKYIQRLVEADSIYRQIPDDLVLHYMSFNETRLKMDGTLPSDTIPGSTIASNISPNTPSKMPLNGPLNP
jgi:hypothetical protein